MVLQNGPQMFAATLFRIHHLCSPFERSDVLYGERILKSA